MHGNHPQRERTVKPYKTAHPLPTPTLNQPPSILPSDYIFQKFYVLNLVQQTPSDSLHCKYNIFNEILILKRYTAMTKLLSEYQGVSCCGYLRPSKIVMEFLLSFLQIDENFKSLTVFAKKLHHRCQTGSQICFYREQVFMHNSRLKKEK